MRRFMVTSLIALALVPLFPFAALASEPTATPTSAPTTEPSAVDLARANVAAGDTAGAVRSLEPYVQTHPADIVATRLLGDLYYRLPDYKRAEMVWRALVVRDPSDRETHNRLGSLYAVQDRLAEAIDEFEKSLPIRSGFASLVELHRRNGDLGAFETQIEQNAKLNPFDGAAQLQYGYVLRVLRRYDEAQIVFRHLVAIKPGQCSPLIDMANNLVDLNKIDEAMSSLGTCLQIDPLSYPALVNYGEAYIEKNDFTKARPYFEKALTVRENGPEALVDLGYLEDMKGNWRVAVRYYQQAISADPLQAEAYIDLGYDYNERGLFDLAEAAFLKGLSASPTDGRLHYMLAVTYNIQGKIDLARLQYEIAIKSYEPLVVRAAKAELAQLPAPTN